MPFAKAGLIAGPGPATAADLDNVCAAQVEALKLQASINPADDVPLYREVGVQSFLVQLLSPNAAARPLTPRDFVDGFADAVEEFVDQGVTDFEIHGKPNLVASGYGVSWASATAFSEWFVEVARLLKGLFGPIRVGFPGLVPAGARLPGDAEPAMSESAFLSAAADAVAAADFVCCNVYWGSAGEMRAVRGGMRFLSQFTERFPRKPIVIGEFANVSPEENPAVRGVQYAEYYLACQQYDACPQYGRGQPFERLQAAYAFAARSDDAQHEPLAWWEREDGASHVAVAVGSRPRMPDPSALRLVWPCEETRYTQYYGENQDLYYQHSYNNCFHGGHNGVDIWVCHDDPGSSPIRACHAGTVTVERYQPSGYGHWLRVTSDMPGVGRVMTLYAHLSRVDVDNAAQVQAGDVLGMGGSTGWSSGPHLHLSLKINGLDFPANAGYLNPRPYLDPLSTPRGDPRADYPRTYVLLPPNAGAAWARTVVEATWDEKRFTVGGSADDAGIGNLDVRRVVAVNPAAWNGDLEAFYAQYYPGVIYVPVEALDPAELVLDLKALPSLAGTPAAEPTPSRGRPRVPYARSYVLLPPTAGKEWARAAVDGCWDTHRYTVGGSADDAGIGDLDSRRVLAVNPAAWHSDLPGFFRQHYPNVQYTPVVAVTPDELRVKLGVL